jgi:hypothetical protein
MSATINRCTACRRFPDEPCCLVGGCILTPPADDPQRMHGQGRPVHIPSDEEVRNIWLALFPSPPWVYWLVYAACMLFVVLAFFGCAQPGPVYVAQGIEYHPDDLSPCRPHTSGCTVGKRVYYSTLDPLVLAHEQEHALGGLLHSEPWEQRNGAACARVIDGGRTQWHAGEWICRTAAGFVRG